MKFKATKLASPQSNDETALPSPRYESDKLPLLLSAKNAPALGISRSEFYRITHMQGAPLVILGSRRYLQRDELLSWFRNIPLN